MRLQELLRCAWHIQWAVSGQKAAPRLALLGEMDWREEMMRLAEDARQFCGSGFKFRKLSDSNV